MALNDIKSGGAQDDAPKERIITAAGVLGGWPAIFINDVVNCNMKLFIKATAGEFAGQAIALEIPKGGYREFKLETGRFAAQWTGENSSYLFPAPTEYKYFTITPNPHFYHDKTSKNYHGGYRLYGNCN